MATEAAKLEAAPKEQTDKAKADKPKTDKPKSDKPKSDKPKKKGKLLYIIVALLAGLQTQGSGRCGRGCR